MYHRRFGSPIFAGAALILGASVALAPAASASTGIAGTTRLIASSGTGTLSFAASAASSTGVENPETPGAAGNAALAPDRSHSSRSTQSVGAITQPKSVTAATPGLSTSFDGLDHFMQRFGVDRGHQWSLEPPDQGLCVGSDGHGSTRVVEVVNDVLRIYDSSGIALTPGQSLNQFYYKESAIIRGPNATFGHFITDPSCLYDAATGRWFMDVLTLDATPHSIDGGQDFTGTNHLDLAVSESSDPAGAWQFFSIPVQDDGTQGTPDHNCSGLTGQVPPYVTNTTACFGDYPHIGSDANGIYLTTNEYSFFGPEFHGAQIYAFSKSALTSNPGTVLMTQFDTHGLDTFGFGLNGFTLWPSHANDGTGDSASGGTEYFLSTNGGAEAHDTGNGQSTFVASTQLLIWALTHTSALSTDPAAVVLSNTKVEVGRYTLPPAAEQKAGTQPLRDCLNNNPCSMVLIGIKDPFAEKAASLDSNDTRMQQVTWINGELWGAIDTGLSVSSGRSAGIEWFRVDPSTSSGSVTASLNGQGYVGLGNDNLTYPAIGITSDFAGHVAGVMSFTLVGADYYPSAGYALIDSNGIGDVHIAAAGRGPDDGFTNYKLFGNPPGTTRPRWGDYGAAVVWGGQVWIASEYVGQACSLSQFLNTRFVCGGTRTAFANWDTRISEVNPGT